MGGREAGGAVKPIVQLVRESFPQRPALGAAVSRAILERVAAGELPDTVRLGHPGRVVAFGRQDVASPGYKGAVKAARAAGYEPVERLAGGRAAAYHEGTLSLSRAFGDRNPAGATRARFEEAADLIRAALARLGADARVGEVPGEYCPGDYSVNAGGRVKLAGIGQRFIRGGAHLGAVIVVTGSAQLRAVLVPVYEALELDWDPATAGSVEDEVPGVAREDAEGAILATMHERFEVVEAGLDTDTLRLAERLEPRYRSSP